MHLKHLPILLTLSLIFAFAAFSVYAQETTPTVEPNSGAPITLIPVATTVGATATDAVITMVPIATSTPQGTPAAEATSAEATTAAEVTSEVTAEATTNAEATTEATEIVVEATATTEATTEATLEATVEATAAAVPTDQNGAAPTGVGTLFLLVGIGAVLLVGGTMLARENAQNKSDAG